MSWNLWWRFGPWEARLPAIAAVVAAEAPDVLCLQEVWSAEGTSSAEILAAGLGWHHVLTDDPFAAVRAARGAEAGPAGHAGFHNAIVSRWPIVEHWSHPLPRADGTPGHRRVLVARLAAPWGDALVASTHFDHRFDESQVRCLQSEALLRVVAEHRGPPDTAMPMVVGGDFNAVPDSDEIRMLTGRRAATVPNLVLSDSWEHVGGPDGATWRIDNPYQASTAWPNRRLDYVFVSWPRPKPVGNPIGAWLAGLHPVDGVHPSDHAAVVVDLHTP